MAQSNIIKTILIFLLAVLIIVGIITGIAYLINNSNKEKNTNPSFDLDEKSVQELISKARNENRISQWGTGLAREGSRESILTLLKAIELTEREEQQLLARSLQVISTSEASLEMIDFLIINSDNSVIAPLLRDAIAKNAGEKEVGRIYEEILKIDSSKSPLNSEDFATRSYLIGTIGGIQREEAIPSLINIGLKGTSSGIYAHIASALSSIGTPQAINGLVEIIEKLKITNNNDPMVQSLANIKNKDSIEELQKIRRITNNPAILYAVNSSLEILQ